MINSNENRVHRTGVAVKMKKLAAPVSYLGLGNHGAYRTYSLPKFSRDS